MILTRLSSLRITYLLLCMTGLAVTASSNNMGSLADVPPPVGFREHLIDHFPGAYQCAVADINGDGKPDIVALSSEQVAWYENPTWKKHVITTNATTRGDIDIAAYDLDGDGKLEMAIASEFDLGNTQKGGRLQWFKPEVSGAEGAAAWTGHEFAKLPTAHRLRWADWDGNGKKELVVVPILGPGATAPAYSAPLSIMNYRFPVTQGTVGEPTVTTIDRSLTVAHGMRILDFDGEGHDDLLVASYEGVTLFKPKDMNQQGTNQQGTNQKDRNQKTASRTWQKIPLGAGEQSNPAKRGSSEVDRGWLKGPNGEKGAKGKRPFLATIEPWHGNEVVVYLPPVNGKDGKNSKADGKLDGKTDGSGLWRRLVIDNTLDDGHALVCADLLGDGQSEILASYRGGGHNLYCYRCVSADGTQWERSVIDAGGMAGAGIVAADINGDGRLDLVCSGSATANIKWYENLGPTPVLSKSSSK